MMRLPEATIAAPAITGSRVDVIGIGVQKAATTWLFRCIAEHPEVRTANPRAIDPADRLGTAKEINFFNRYHERGYAWYHRMFDFGDWKTMEFSVLYFHDLNVPARIHRYNPAARLILALRNPIDRAYSHHRHEVRLGRLPSDLHDFWRALEHNPSYLELGMYATHLTRWLDHFDAEQIHVVDHAEIRTRPTEVIRGILDFIGVDSRFTPAAVPHRINDGHATRSHQLNRALRDLSDGVRNHLGDAAWRTLKSTRVPRLVRALNRVDRSPTGVLPLRAEDRDRLARVFADENERLSELLGRDFTHWR